MLIKINSKSPKEISLDTETTGLRHRHGDLPFACSMAYISGGDFKYKYWEWPVDPFTREVDYTSIKDGSLLQDWAEDERITKIFFNAKFDIRMLRKAGIQVQGKFEEVSFAARICNTLEREYKLKYLSNKYLGISKDDEDELHRATVRLRRRAKDFNWNISTVVQQDYWLNQYTHRLGMPEIPEGLVKKYAIGDVQRTLGLWLLYENLMSTDARYRQFYELETRDILPLVMEMEDIGLGISKKRNLQELNNAKKNAEHYLREMQKTLNDTSFNPNSPQQLVSVLYDSPPKGYGLSIEKLTESKMPSTDWKALRKHANHSFVRLLTAYKAADKSIGTFFQKYEDMMLPDLNSPGGFCLHPDLKQTGTKTLRFSCADPNLQQVANSDTSARGTDPIQARAPFGPRKGYVWVGSDYAQMELRVFADCARVSKMLEAIHAGRDVNTENCNLAWGGRDNPAALEAMAYALELGHDEPSKEEVKEAWERLEWNKDLSKKGVSSDLAFRRAEEYLAKFDYDIVKAEKSLGKSGSRGRAKIIMFTKFYGGGAEAVADLLYTDVPAARKFMGQFDKVFPEMAQYMKRLSSQAEVDGYIINRWGRKLHVDRAYSYRAINYMIQGSCADLMKSAMRKCNTYLKSLGVGRILLTIHDELLFEIEAKHCYPYVIRELESRMEDHEGNLGVPMKVESKIMRVSWSKKEEVKL